MLTLIAGVVPLLIQRSERTRHWLIGAEHFARGIFLGAGLIHLLPDAQNNFAHLEVHHHYPYPVTLCALTIFLLKMVETMAIRSWNARGRLKHAWLPWLLILVLSLHSMIAGAALGLSMTMASLLIIFLAIIAHKGAESFALTVSMLRVGFDLRRTSTLLLGFAFMTPIGILVGGSLNLFLQQDLGHMARGIFDAIAAGTFFYIATSHHLDQGTGDGVAPDFWEIIYFGSGILTMALIAIWL